MRAYLESLRVVLRSGWTVLATALGVVGVAGFFVTLPRLPTRIALGLAFAAVWWATFRAFHTLRMWQAGVLRPAPGSRPQANRLAWSARVEGFAPPLTSPCTGFVIRIVISDARPATPGDITSDTIDHLGAILGSPAIDRLFAFGGSEPPVDRERGDWALSQRSTWMVEFRRNEQRSPGSGSVISARCLLQKPMGSPNFPAGPSPLLLLDVVATDVGDAERLTLSLVTLMAVVTAGMDAAANHLTALFPPLVCSGRWDLQLRPGRRIHLVGPNVEVCGVGRGLHTICELGHLERAPESREFQNACFDTPLGCDVRDSTNRARVTRCGLVKMLRENGYRRPEAAVSDVSGGSGS
jgi:hypothetical protein